MATTLTGRRLRKARISPVLMRVIGQLVSDALLEQARILEQRGIHDVPEAPGYISAASDLRSEAFFIRQDVEIQEPLEPIL